MKVNGKMLKNKEKGNLWILRINIIKANLIKTSSMDMELKDLRMVIIIKENIIWENSQVKEFISGKMDLYILVNSTMVLEMDLVYGNHLIIYKENNTKVNIGMIKNVVEVDICGKMVHIIMVHF